ncbi:hypothetical protein [Microbulbifer variabilis]|uniref:hypothetical protein n=1 Tax=Microbulbifer variabilis TaxID=266805 RepID=UPI001CFE6BAB|nr:hypothetical protein [Microbulbifer variabilis]
MFKKLSLPVVLTAVVASANSFAEDCQFVWVDVPIAWEKIYSYRNLCSYSFTSSYRTQSGDYIEVIGAADDYQTSWSADLKNVLCPSTRRGEINYVNLSNPQDLIPVAFGTIPLKSAELQTKEEKGEPIEWERRQVVRPRGCIPW